MLRPIKWLLMVLFLGLTPIVMAQGDCAAIVQAALKTTEQACAATGRNQACYGNNTLQAEAAPKAPQFTFASPGDQADLTTIQTLRLSAMDMTIGEWGVALLQVQADIPDSQPGDARVLLFGDVQLDSAFSEYKNGVPAIVHTIRNDTLNLRPKASTDTKIIEKMKDNAPVTVLNGPIAAEGFIWWYLRSAKGNEGWAVASADGVQTLIFPTLGKLAIGGRAAVRTAENDPLNMRTEPSLKADIVAKLSDGTQVTLTDGPRDAEGYTWWKGRSTAGDEGWLVASVGDLQTLATPVRGPKFGAMQSFYLKTGSDDAPCDQAPDSGLMIQTPEGVGEINLLVNEVDIQLGSTVYLQTDQKTHEMIVNVVEGQAQVQSAGIVQIVPAGSRVRIPLDSAFIAAGAPTPPEPYDFARMQVLPISLLTRAITIAPALTQAQIDDRVGLKLAGRWTITWPQASKSCQTGQRLGYLNQNNSIRIDDGGALFFIRYDQDATYVRELSRVGLQAYEGYLNTGGLRLRTTMQVKSPTHIEGVEYANLSANCQFSSTFVMDRSGDS